MVCKLGVVSPFFVLIAVLHYTLAVVVNETHVVDLQSTVRVRGLEKRDEGNVAGFLNNGGWLTYDGFDTENKNLGASALMNTDTYRNLGQGTDPDRGIEPSGWDDIVVASAQLRQRCHLIAAVLGGSNKDARNFVTCHGNANSPIMRHYEKKIQNLLDAIDPNGPWKRDKGVLYYAIPDYGSDAYPNRIRLRSELYMHGEFQEVLQDLYVFNRDRNGRRVRFLCRGTFAQDGPPSLPLDRIEKSSAPCPKSVHEGVPEESGGPNNVYFTI